MESTEWSLAAAYDVVAAAAPDRDAVVPDPESVPMSATGKLDKSALQQLLLSRGKRQWR